MLQKRVWLKKMRVINFQSWKDQVVAFSDGLNVFIADNEVGKSVMLKIIDCIVNFERLPKEAKQNYIRRGCNSSEVTYLFSNNNLYKFTITQKTLTAVARIDNKVTQNTVAIRERFIKDFSLIIEPKSGFICNILGDDKAKFLVNTDSRSDGYFLSTLTNHDKIEDIIQITDDRVKKLRLQESKLNAELKVIDRTLENLEFYDLEDMRDNYDYIETLVDSLDYADELNFYIYEFIKCGVEDLNADLILDITNAVEGLSTLNFERLHEVEDSILDILDITQELSSFNLDKYEEEIDKDILNVLDDLFELSELSKGSYSEVVEKEILEDLEILNKDYKYNDIYLKDKDYIAIAQLTGISDMINNYNDVESDINYSWLKELASISNLLGNYNNIHLDNTELIFIDRLRKFSELNLEYHNIDDIMNRIQEIKEENETEEVDCPLYGRITIVNGECNI